MEKFQKRATAHDGPEAKIHAAIESYLRSREWYVKSTHGNQFQAGFPDIYASHLKYGMKWIEVKNPEQFSFTPAQIKEFPKMSAAGTYIWILCDATDAEYERLFKPANWMEWFVCYQAGCRSMSDWRAGRVKNRG
jgi:hypothetical protein